MTFPFASAAPADISFVMMAAALFIAFFRLVVGPSLPDRVIALDLFAMLVVGVIVVFSVQSGQAVYLEAAVVVGLITFLGTVAFARYLERREHDE
jgi:multicomponent Na+:H+ antiporter subunit F